MTTCNPGDILAGKYRVDRVLGAGGMGVVVAATHLALGQQVAMKFMLPEAMAAQEAMDRFLREARAASRLRSEHVATVQDVGTLENGAPYIVMQYLEGTDLSHLVEQRGALSGIEAVDYLLQACAGLAEAHAQGIVHRDLKPANLFLCRRVDGSPLVKILDFGISKVNTGADAGMTRTQSVMGSPNYMSPEQVRSSRQADARSDIWSLGVVLYELVSCRVPFSGESFTDICVRIAVDQPTPLVLTGPNNQIPPALANVIMRCLQKDPAQRYQSVAELAMALAPFGPEGSFQKAKSIAQTLGVQVAASPQTSGYSAVGTGGYQRLQTSPSLGTGTGTGTQNLAGEVGSRTVRRSRKLPLLVGAGVVAVGSIVGAIVGLSSSAKSGKPDTELKPAGDPSTSGSAKPDPKVDPKPIEAAVTSKPAPPPPPPQPVQPAALPPDAGVVAKVPDAAPPEPVKPPPKKPTPPPTRPTRSTTKPIVPSTTSKPAGKPGPSGGGEDDLDIRK